MLLKQLKCNIAPGIFVLAAHGLKVKILIQILIKFLNCNAYVWKYIMHICSVSLHQLTEGSIPIALAISSYLSSHGCIPEAGCKFKVFWRFLVLHLCEVYMTIWTLIRSRMHAVHRKVLECNNVSHLAIFTHQLFLFRIRFSYIHSSLVNIIPSNWFTVACLWMFIPP